jgi:MFS family permease
VFGLITDSVSIYGLRRKPYFLLGWAIFVECNIVLAMQRQPCFIMLIVALFFMTCGFVLADVCVDALVVERTSLYGAQLQTTGYSFRFFGGILGALFGAISFSKPLLDLSISQVFLINALVPVLVVGPLLVIFGLQEEQRTEKIHISDQISALWEMVKLQAVYRPCAFIFIYSKISNTQYTL